MICINCMHYGKCYKQGRKIVTGCMGYELDIFISETDDDNFYEGIDFGYGIDGRGRSLTLVDHLVHPDDFGNN